MDGKGKLGARTLAVTDSSGARLSWQHNGCNCRGSYDAPGKPGSPVPHAIVNPVSGTDTLEGRCPVVKAGVEMQAVQQVGSGPDDPEEGESVTQPGR